jgi:photosystem II P680 reaction center D1 protein
MPSVFKFIPHGSSDDYDEWLYNVGAYQLFTLHVILAISNWMGREWEFSFRLGVRPWIFFALSAPVIAATAFLIIYHVGQSSFSNGMHLGVGGTSNFVVQCIDTFTSKYIEHNNH